jgi:hypothetical protein
MSITVCVYFPKDPATLFKFLDSVVGYEAWRAKTGQKFDPVEVLLWMDNDDHKSSSEFYTLRRYIRKGMNIQVFINPSLGSSDAVFRELESKASGDEVFSNTGYENHFGLLMGGSTVFDEEQQIREVKQHG